LNDKTKKQKPKKEKKIVQPIQQPIVETVSVTKERESKSVPKPLPTQTLSWSSIVSHNIDLTPTFTESRVTEPVDVILRPQDGQDFTSQDRELPVHIAEKKQKPKKEKKLPQAKTPAEKQIIETAVAHEALSEAEGISGSSSSEFNIQLPAPSRPSVWSSSETYAEVVKKSGFSNNTNIKYQNEVSEQNVRGQDQLAPEEQAHEVLLEFPDPIIPPIEETKTEDYLGKPTQLSWKDLIDEDEGDTAESWYQEETTAVKTKPQEPIQERRSRISDKPTIKITEIINETQLQPDIDQGFLEITSKKRNRSRSRSQLSQISNLDEKPQKKKSKKPKNKSHTTPIQKPAEALQNVEPPKETKPFVEERNANVPVRKPSRSPSPAPSPYTSGMSWAAIAAHNVPEPAQQIRPLQVETKNTLVEDVRNLTKEHTVTIPINLGTTEQKTKKTKQKSKRKSPTDVVDFINAEKYSHEAIAPLPVQKEKKQVETHEVESEKQTPLAPFIDISHDTKFEIVPETSSISVEEVAVTQTSAEIKTPLAPFEVVEESESFEESVDESKMSTAPTVIESLIEDQPVSEPQKKTTFAGIVTEPEPTEEANVVDETKTITTVTTTTISTETTRETSVPEEYKKLEEPTKPAYAGLPVDDSSSSWMDVLDEPMNFSDDEEEPVPDPQKEVTLVEKVVKSEPIVEDETKTITTVTTTVVTTESTSETTLPEEPRITDEPEKKPEEPKKPAYAGLPVDDSSSSWMDVLDEPMNFSDDEEIEQKTPLAPFKNVLDTEETELVKVKTIIETVNDVQKQDQPVLINTPLAPFENVTDAAEVVEEVQKPVEAINIITETVNTTTGNTPLAPFGVISDSPATTGVDDAFICETSYWSATLKPGQKPTTTTVETTETEPEEREPIKITIPSDEVVEEVSVKSPTDQPTTWSAIVQTEATVFPALEEKKITEKTPDWSTVVVSKTTDFQEPKALDNVVESENVTTTTTTYVTTTVTTHKDVPIVEDNSQATSYVSTVVTSHKNELVLETEPTVQIESINPENLFENLYREGFKLHPQYDLLHGQYQQLQLVNLTEEPATVEPKDETSSSRSKFSQQF